MKNSVEETHLNSRDNIAVNLEVYANDNENTHVDEMISNDMRIKGNTNNSIAKQPMEHNHSDTDEVPSAIMDTLNSTHAVNDVPTCCVENSTTLTHDLPKNSGLASGEHTLSNCRHESSSTITDQPTCNVAHHSDPQVLSNEFNDNHPEYRLFNSSNDDMVGEHLLHDPSNDQVTMAFVSDTIPTERSLDAETWSSSQDNSLLHHPRPGFQGLGQAEGIHQVVATDDQVPSPSHVPSVDMTPSPYDGLTTSTDPSGWFTPPQSPPLSIAAVHAATVESTLPSGSLCVNGTILGKSTPMLVDTGASISAVSNAFFHKLSPIPQITPSDLPFIRTVSGEQLPVIGKATLTFLLDNIPYSFSISVIDQLTYPVVLGRDFLMHFNSVIDMQNYTLSLSGNQPILLGPDHSINSLQQSTGSEPVTVHAFATYILPPLSESIIPVYAKVSLPVGSTGLIEPSPRLAERYQICGAAQLVCLAETNTFPFRVLDPTNSPVTIYRCSTMGAFTRSDASMSVITTEDVPIPTPSAPTDNNTVPLDLSDSTLTADQKVQLQTLVNEYRDIFALSPDELGRTDLVQHHIDTGDHAPIRQRPYRVSDKQRGIIEEHVTDMLNRGIIQPSVSPWASSVVLVKKKDNTDRFCVDFRRLNAVTRKDSYPLPRIDDTLDALNGTQFFSTMDLLSGYWQVSMHADSREHTAFITYGGLYEFLVTPFGLANAPSTYQRLMECVLRNLTYKICLIYLDDILVYSRTFVEHLDHLRQVFDRLRHANLKLKPSKCNFACTKVNYLGHVVSPNGIAPDPEKISAVKDFPRPHNVKTIRSFLGLANYYRRFVKDFAKIAAPLNQLLRKDHKFVWTSQCEDAFQALKEALTSAPILAFPNFSEMFHLFVDASNDGIGATLGQIQDGKEVAIAYAGRDFNSAERNYSTTEREALAVIFGIKKFEPYLHGRKFILHTDHHSLKWLMNITDPTGRLARWALLVQQHDFEIRHRPGANHANADALSRRPYKLTAPDISAYDIPGVQTSRIHELQRRDPDLADLISYLETISLPQNNATARSLLLMVDDYFLDSDGLLFHLWTPSGSRRRTTYQQLVVPDALRYEILTWGHDDPTAGHFGTTKTYEKLRTRYYWRHMFSDIQHWIRSCADCSMRKTPRNRHKAPLMPIPVEGAFDRLAVDCLGPLTTSAQGNRYVVVFCDAFTRWSEAFPVPSIDAPTIARLLVDEILCRHGAPRTLLLDRGSNFLSVLIKEVCKLINTRKINTSSYHPQSDGMVERFNNTLAESISMFVSSNQKDWDLFIPSILFAYRVSPCVSTGDSPFYLLYGREPRLPPDVSLLPQADVSTSIAEHRSRIVRQLETAHSIAQRNVQRAQQLMKFQYDKNAKETTFQLGQRVWVYTPKTKKGLSKKLLHKWHGPYRICRILSPVHYQLRTCDNRLIATTVHANRMKPYYDPSDRPIQPPPDDPPNESFLSASELPEDSFIPDDDTQVMHTNSESAQEANAESHSPSVDSSDSLADPDVYAAERILRSRRKNGQVQYLVKWVGFPASQSTWEPEENILDHRLLDQFHDKHK